MAEPLGEVVPRGENKAVDFATGRRGLALRAQRPTDEAAALWGLPSLHRLHVTLVKECDRVTAGDSKEVGSKPLDRPVLGRLGAAIDSLPCGHPEVRAQQGGRRAAEGEEKKWW